MLEFKNFYDALTICVQKCLDSDESPEIRGAYMRALMDMINVLEEIQDGNFNELKGKISGITISA